MQHIDKHIYNIRPKTQIKHWYQSFATYIYNHYNIPIYFCNIHLKHLQHTSKSETLETYAQNIHFQQNLVGGALHSRIGCAVMVEKEAGSE
jgi:hypothetical protein